MKNIIVFILISALYSTEISFSPGFSFLYESEGGMWYNNNKSLIVMQPSLKIKAISGKWNISADYFFNMILGQNSGNFFFNYQRGYFQNEALIKSYKPGDTFWSDYDTYRVNAKVEYQSGNTSIYFGKINTNYGPGIHSIFYSNQIPSPVMFGYNWKVNNYFKYIFSHSYLRSLIKDSNQESIYTTNIPQVSRNMIFHRIEWHPYEWVDMGFSETIIYANRELDMTYIFGQFIPYISLQNYLDDTDNLNMVFDVLIKVNNSQYYGVFFMDEWSPPVTFDDNNNHNWFGWQGGFEYEDIFIPGSRLRMEYTWTDHRIYRHKFPINDFYSWGYPVGFWAGPHAQELYAEYTVPIMGNNLRLIYSDAKRGELTEQMLIDQYDIINYERFSGDTEEKKVVRILISRRINKKILCEIGYNYIDWENTEFSPTTPQLDESMSDIIKHSLGISLQYNY